ncbi:MAG: putative selenium-dependent hydroxylase accessory protein YqeC [Chloroflexi bacterium]|nr:putative selenium-dependent hydroxylase accessory protein YqeC [Chloroflexota bacterium]
MRIREALRLQTKEVVAFVGGGGKTTAMFRLADELVAQGKRVVTTTTTRIFAAQRRLAPQALTYDAAFEFGARVLDALDAKSSVLVIGAETEDGKALGVPPAFVDELIALDSVDAVLVEADGARTRSFKAPADHEPVIPGSTTLLVPVMGVRVLGAPLDDKHVHRAELVARLAGAHLGETITPNIAARVLAHAEGGLKNKPRDARAIIFVNQVESAAELDAARALAGLLLGYGAINAVALGAAQMPEPIRETHRRVAVVVLAAGGSTRMEGRVKQLLPLRGKPLIRNAVDLAAKSPAQQIIVVLGAHAEEIRLAIHDAPAQVIVNSNWASGHASSIRAGLLAVSPYVDAVLFVNADQPLLTPRVLEQIIQRRHETDAHIVVPFYAGKRGSPVLFDRTHMDALLQLTGEQGGREVLNLYRDEIARVDFDDARLGFDVDTPADFAQLETESK